MTQKLGGNPGEGKIKKLIMVLAGVVAALLAATWPAGSFSYRIQQAPAFPPINGYAGRWVPLTGADIEGRPGYKAGSSISLRYWGHSAGCPTECIVVTQRPLIVESGTLAIANPPETRADLTQYPGALTLNFGPSPTTG